MASKSDRSSRPEKLSPAFKNAEVFQPHGCGIDWKQVEQDASIPVVVTDSPIMATVLCRSGQPALSVSNISKKRLAKILRNSGARVFTKELAS